MHTRTLVLCSVQCVHCTVYTLTYSTYVKLPSKCCKKSCGIIQFRNWQNIFFRISQIFVSLKILILSYSKIFIRFHLRWIIRKLNSRNLMALYVRVEWIFKIGKCLLLPYKLATRLKNCYFTQPKSGGHYVSLQQIQSNLDLISNKKHCR